MTDLRATRRAFLTVTALRWLPTGLLIPTVVLLQLDRGLTLAQIGLVSATQGVVVVLLELPTGGLADAWGRRPVLALASATAIASVGVLLVARSPEAFVLAWALQGAYRALDSGPLEAWYVDAALAAEPARELHRDLSRASVVLYTSIATGALAAAGLALLPAVAGTPRANAVVACLVLEALHLAAVVMLVRERRPARGWAALRTAVTNAPATVALAAKRGWTLRPLRLVLAVELSWGAGLAVVELLWQPHVQAATGQEHPWLFGVMGASAWVVGAGGALLVPLLVRCAGGRVVPVAMAGRVLQGGTVVAFAYATGPAGLVTAFVAFYLVHGTSGPCHETLLHARADSAVRASVLSLNSLVSRAGALPATLALPAVAGRWGTSTALLLAGLLLATAAPLYLRSGEPPRQPDAVDRLEPLPAG
ncbi:MFS transporter [Motilibacter deserti]|uniref:MFS transporter n=1 Tax=Motilibacter deserti TaxID=2714956 RepID=A0ABX0GSN0_9ACTN|nr:MFS transporter [Motilibacter deserti]NHC12695.1 MFS transporter [Motilibacter deserti]